MKRILWFALLVMAVMMLAVPALAQDAGEVSGTVADAVTPYIIVSAFVKMAIDRLRTLIPQLDGLLVNLAALALGFAATFVPDVLDVSTFGERLTAAAAIAGVSAVFADVSARS